jgi:hypothetical protein
MATILRNPDGSIEFPSRIPPQVEFPHVITPGGTPKRSTSDPANCRNSEAGGMPHPPQHLSATLTEPIATARPGLGQQWMTDRPQAARQESMAPHLHRKGTNISALNEAIWTYAKQEDEESSSSSSSDDDEQEGRRQKRRRSDIESPYGRFHVGNDKFKTRGKVSKRDGRLNISVNETDHSGYLAKALGASFLKNIGSKPQDDLAGAGHVGGGHPDVSTASSGRDRSLPTLNIVVMVIGSRGDIQPFLKLGKVLKEEYGHRVRIATHPAFRDFVQKDSGLEFFSVGGDPAELMAFMVKNPGMIPKMETVRAG